MRQLAFDTKLPSTGASHIPYADLVEMANYYFQNGMEAFAGKIADATGAAMDVTTPFDPAVVIIFNETDLSVHAVTPSVAAGKSFEWKADVALNAANGITLGTKKFTIGTAANLNALHDVLHWIAFGFRDQNGSL